MGKRKQLDVNNKIKEKFKYCENKKEYQCTIDTCQKFLKSEHVFNWKRHIVTCHREVAVEMDLISEESEGSKKKQQKKISIEMNEETFTKACVQLATLNNLPFRLFEYAGFKDIIAPISQAFNININSHNIGEHIRSTADKIRNHICKEIEGKLIHLKVDAATRCGRSILGVNIQFLNGPTIVIRSLGMLEVFKKHTAEHLKEEIMLLLHTYNVSPASIYAATTDNGANLLKAVRLLKEHSIDVDEEQTDDLAIEENDVYEYTEQLISPLLSSVRCAAHTIQLSVHDVLKYYSEQLNKIREIVKKLRNNPYKNSFTLNGARKPFLDVITRWNSTYNMILCLNSQRQFITDLINRECFEISEELWQFIDQFVLTFKPVYTATIKLQQEQLIMGDFFKIWLECKIELESLNNELSRKIVDSMLKRKVKLFDNNAFLAAVYMDPRLNYFGSDLLSESDKCKATVSNQCNYFNAIY